MSKPESLRLALRLMIMSVLIVCVLLITPSNKTLQTVLAAPCCEECDANEEICLQPDHGGYSSYLECANAYRIHQCRMSCVFCN